VAFGDVPLEDEARSLVSFEWHMLGMLRQGKFALCHPERDGECISLEDWAVGDEDEIEDADAAAGQDSSA
jgi:hypothetical protein